MAKSPTHLVPPLPRPSLRYPKEAKPVRPAVELANREALRNVLAGTTSAVGLGALLRGLKAIPEVLAPPTPTPVGVTGAPTVITLRRDPEERATRPLSWIQPAAAGGFKQAAAPAVPAAPAAPAAPDMLGRATDFTYDNVMKPLGLDKIDMLGGTTHPSAKPWYLPALMGGIATGGAAGWKLVDWLADRNRKGQRDTELAAAEKDYLSAVQDMQSVKMAGLDAARAQLHKQANSGSAPPKPLLDPTVLPGAASQSWANALGRWGVGPLAGLAALTAIPSGIAAYKYVRDSSDSRALQEALATRRRAMQMRNPAPPQFVLEEEKGAA